jgi:quercetin dioxygenase-like cupin family protein
MEDVVIRRRGESEKSIKIGKVPIYLLARTEKLESMIVEMPPNSEIPKTYSHGGEEIRIVLKGEIEVDTGGEKYILREGDVMWHKSELPHRIRNPGKEKAVYFSVNMPPTLEW